LSGQLEVWRRGWRTMRYGKRSSSTTVFCDTWNVCDYSKNLKCNDIWSCFCVCEVKEMEFRRTLGV
jgi:hypothetical protein